MQSAMLRIQPRTRDDDACGAQLRPLAELQFLGHKLHSRVRILQHTWLASTIPSILKI